MCKLYNIPSPFEKYVPSVFVVSSPLQILCALSAIKQLEIKEYKIIVYLLKGDCRKTQMINLMEKNNIKYTLISYINIFTIQLVKLFAIIRRKNEYSRLFIGDIRNIVEIFIGYCHVSDNSTVVSLDDGNGIIAILKNKASRLTTNCNLKILNTIFKYRHLYPYKNLLTIYSDIPNPNYCIKELQLNNVASSSDRKRGYKNVIIVGTYIAAYCEPVGISEQDFIKRLSALMKKIKADYPNEEVIFVPHGRENSNYGEVLCKENGCTYKRPNIMIELELLDSPFIPKAIYGFTSGALFTLKKMFPETRVVNILFDMGKNVKESYNEYIDISDYFVKNGIELYKDKLY